MIEKAALLTIGELSKATGVGIKSLKYYEAIGILKPAFIDEANGYRYFSLKQSYWIEIIQMSISFGIPLKNLHDYIDEQDLVDYQALFTRGKKEIQQQLDELLKRLNFIEHVERDFESMEHYGGSQQVYPLELAEKHFLVEPIEKNASPAAIKKAFSKLSSRAGTLGIKAMFWDTGKLFEYRPDGTMTRHVYVQVPASVPESILSPAGTYLCRQSPHEQIEEAGTFFPQIQKPGHWLLIEMDIFQQKSSYQNSRKEIRVLEII